MTTLRRERKQKFKEVITNSEIYMQCRLGIDELSQELDELCELLADAAESRSEKVKLSIENAIATGQPVTEDMMAESNLKDTAPKMFEKALGFSKPLPWWSDKEWTAFAEWVCAEYAKSNRSFGEYQVWRGTPYTKGGITNQRIRGFPAEFYDSWDMFRMSVPELQPATTTPKVTAQPEPVDAIPNPFKVKR